MSFVGPQFLLASVLAFVAISSAWATTLTPTLAWTSLALYIQKPSELITPGQIAGHFQDDIGSHGFVRDSSGVFTTWDVPGASHTLAFGINDAGQIVGYFNDVIGSHGFVREAVVSLLPWTLLVRLTCMP